MEHVGKADLVTFFFYPPNRALHSRVTRHLCTACGECHQRAKEVLGLIENPRVATDSQALTLFLRESSLLKDERSKAAVNWARLASLGEQERINLMRLRWRYKKYGLAAYVLGEAEAFAARGSRETAKELVRFSAAVTDGLPDKVYGAAPISDLRLRQNTVLSNILRLDLDFIAALAVLRKAEVLLREGIDLAERARFFRVQASLLADLGDLEAAAVAAREAGFYYEKVFDPHSTGRALLQEAMILAYLQPDSGLDRASHALAILDSPDSKSFVYGVFTKAYCLIKLDRQNEADSFLSAYREVIREVCDPEMDLWFRHLDALILKARGNFKEAETILSHVALRFCQEGMVKEMILQHLERIKIKVDTGRWKSAINIATGLTPELARLGLRNDLLAMWASLQDALAQRRDAVREIESLFRRRWHAPAKRASDPGLPLRND